MTAVDLYRRLPRKNCGGCPQRLCMPFALAVLRGEAVLSQCPFLSDEEREALGASLKPSDWREALIARLSEEVKGISFAGIAEGIGATVHEGSLRIHCLGREFMISPDGAISTAGHITPWMKILLLHYMRTAGTGPLSGRWVSFSELKGGMVKASALERECEEPLREIFDAGPEGTAAALERLGAERRSGFPTPSAWHIRLLPKIPVVILFWHADDEFPSKVKIIFDESADRFLDAESLIFLVEGLIRNIEMIVSRSAS